MRTSKIAREDRASKLDTLKEMLELKNQEKRNFTDEEANRFNVLDEDIYSLNEEIRQLEREEKMAGEIAKPVTNDKKKMEKKESRFFENLRTAIKGGQGKFEANTVEMRAIDTANDGSALSTQAKGYIERLLPFMAVGEMNPDVYSDLEGEGDLILPTGKAAKAYWTGEGNAPTYGDGGFDSVTVARKNISATVVLSNSYALATTFDAQQKVIEQINKAVAERLNETIINGSGANEPAGILTASGVTKVINASIDAGAVVDLKKEVRKLGVKANDASFVFNLDDYATLEDTSRGVNSDLPVISEKGTTHGMKALMDATVPDDTALAGDGNGIKIGQWGSLRFVVDPYTYSANDQTKITVNMTCGVGIDTSRFVISKTA